MPFEFVDRCGEFDGSEQIVCDNITLPFVRRFGPIFGLEASFQDTVLTLDAFAKFKHEHIDNEYAQSHTCLPWVAPSGSQVYHRNVPRMRIAIFTTATTDSKNLVGKTYTPEDQAMYDRAYNLSLDDKAEYCARHGYDFHVFKNVVEGRSVGWSRIPAALSILGRYDWIFYVDLDSVILDHNVRLQEFLDPHFDVILGVDMNGINNGVFGLRNSTWSRMLYAEAWTRTDVLHSEFWFEQAALMALMAESDGVRNHMKLVPQEHFNTYLGPEDILPKQDHPAFIVHFAGLENKWALVERFVKERKNVVIHNKAISVS